MVISTTGHGFIVPASECLAQTKNGKNVLTVSDGIEAALCLPADKTATHLCIIGTNRKMLVFPVADIPEMNKGKGVILQKYADGAAPSDAQLFTLKSGINFISGSKTMTVTDMKPWVAARASMGKLPPNGFPRSNRFA